MKFTVYSMKIFSFKSLTVRQSSGGINNSTVPQRGGRGTTLDVDVGGACQRRPTGKGGVRGRREGGGVGGGRRLPEQPCSTGGGEGGGGVGV